jgi:hypothetical protein
MKKGFVFAAVLITLCSAPFASAEVSDALTDIDGWLHLNGRVFEEHVGNTVPESWMIGILDALKYTHKPEMDRLYPKGNNADIIKAVKRYYILNPLKKGRPIVEVILAGCR